MSDRVSPGQLVRVVFPSMKTALDKEKPLKSCIEKPILFRGPRQQRKEMRAFWRVFQCNTRKRKVARPGLATARAGSRQREILPPVLGQVGLGDSSASRMLKAVQATRARKLVDGLGSTLTLRLPTYQADQD